MNTYKAVPSKSLVFFFQDPIGISTVNDGDFQKFLNDRFPMAIDIDQDIVDVWFSELNEKGQSMVTHNPLLLNFMDDEVAKERVVVPTLNGFALFGDLQELVSKLDALGPGEAVLDIALSDITPITANILDIPAPWVD